jgi:hypothetical protein
MRKSGRLSPARPLARQSRLFNSQERLVGDHHLYPWTSGILRIRQDQRILISKENDVSHSQELGRWVRDKLRKGCRQHDQVKISAIPDP